MERPSALEPPQTVAKTRCEDFRLSDEEITRAAQAVQGELHGINNIIDVYCLGKAPRHPDIDAMSFDPKSPQFQQLVQTAIGVVNEEDTRLFFQPSLRFALKLLEINHRDDAARHEPLEKTLNAEVLRRIPSIAWSKYPYTAILLPGYGPDRPSWPLSPQSRLRAELAARRFHAGKAPLIIVSGGYVHPNQTPYNEAIEMKRVLVEDFGVPADAVITEPHARHTTTNLRNAARLMSRYRIPFDRNALITTDAFQSAYIAGDAFAQRCRTDLGYLPVTLGRRVSPFDLEFTPRIESLQADAMDPLDP